MSEREGARGRARALGARAGSAARAVRRRVAERSPDARLDYVVSYGALALGVAGLVLGILHVT